MSIQDKINYRVLIVCEKFNVDYTLDNNSHGTEVVTMHIHGSNYSYIEAYGFDRCNGVKVICNIDDIYNKVDPKEGFINHLTALLVNEGVL